MRAIFELIWAAYCPSVAKYSRFVFCQLAELVIFVLQLQISELNLINDFLAQLRVHRDPYKLSFLRNSFIFGILERVEAHLV